MVGEELSPALRPDTSLREIKGRCGGEETKLQNVLVPYDDERLKENQGIVLGMYKQNTPAMIHPLYSTT